MDIKAFTFVAKTKKGNEENELIIYKSLPINFIILLLFKKYRTTGNKVWIGSDEQAIFELDLEENKLSLLVKSHPDLNEFKYEEVNSGGENREPIIN